MKVAGHDFVEAVASLTFENTFNPYRDRCEVFDSIGAPQSRATVLSEIVTRAAETTVDAIWVGRDLGHRGGRRTGLALTDDVHFERHISRWNCSAHRPTVGAAVAERTARVVWDVLNQIERNIFLWNVFPLHPHEANDQFTNRQHNSKERAAGEELLRMLVGTLRPHRLIAVGNDAALVATRVSGSSPVVTVRHPSYGGQATFTRQMTDLYDIRPSGRLL